MLFLTHSIKECKCLVFVHLIGTVWPWSDPVSGTSGCIFTCSPAGDLSLSSMVLHPLGAQSCCALIHWALQGSWQTDGSPSRVKKLAKISDIHSRKAVQLLKNDPRPPRRAVSELTNLGWGPYSCASASCPPVDGSRPVCGDALQFVTYFGGGSNQSIIWCWEPWWGLSLGSLPWAPTFSTCQDAGGECVFIFRSPGGPHDPVRHHAHIHTHTHGEANLFIHIHTGWARNLCSVQTDKSCVFPPLSPLSVRLALRVRHPSARFCPSVQRYSGGLGMGWRGGSDVSLLVLPVSSLIVHRLHPLAN